MLSRPRQRHRLQRMEIEPGRAIDVDPDHRAVAAEVGVDALRDLARLDRGRSLQFDIEAVRLRIMMQLHHSPFRSASIASHPPCRRSPLPVYPVYPTEAVISVHETKTFKSGNSEAVRLPKGMGFGIGVDVRVEREPGGRLVLTPIVDREAQRREMDRVHQAMLAIGAPADGVQPRDPFEFIERPGLE